MSLETRTLGQQGLEVAAIGLGCTGMSQSYGPASVLDTAQVYGNHTTEELLGRALQGRRDAVTLATKLGFNLVPTGSGWAA